MLLTKRGKFRIFRKESIARMDGLGPGCQSCGDDAPAVEITFLRTGAADTDSLIRQRYMQGFPVRFGIDRHRIDAHLLAGPNEASRTGAGNTSGKDEMNCSQNY